MLTFDKLQLVADISSVIYYDESKFEKTEKEGTFTFKYHQEVPYLLNIKIDCHKREVVIEFTGKVLGANYPKLISSDTIRECFHAINSMGLVTLDTDVMMDADVVKCDVTKDIRVNDVSILTNYVRQHISSYQRYVCRKLRNNNLVVEKNVTSRQTKKRMTIYDKGKDMQLAENRRFVEEYGLDGAFDGLCRFELNLNSKAQIRNALGISNTKLQSVLNSNSNPIADFLDAVIDNASTSSTLSDKKEYLTALVLKDCDYDLEKVEAKMRQFHSSRGTSIGAIMKPYRQMLERLNTPEDTDLWRDVRGRLKQ